MMKLLRLLFVLLFFNHSLLFSQCIPLGDLCDFEKFTNAVGISDIEKKEREKVILELVGVIQELNIYRQSFLASMNLVDLFPTAYYHTTLSEYYCIVQGEYIYPKAKVKQLIAFYEAYKFNRQNWDKGNKNLVEYHWKKHFEYAESKKIDPLKHELCGEIGCVLTTGIWAHVKYDLPRAIRSTIDHNLNSDYLYQDFKKTDNIFLQTELATILDVTKNSSCWEWYLNFAGILPESIQNILAGKYIPLGLCNEVINIVGEILTTPNVIEMREIAWLQGYGSVILQGADGSPIAPQPQIDNVYYYKRGKAYCRLSKNKNSTLFLFDLSGSMSDNGGGTTSKLQQAKEASIITLNDMNNYQQSGTSNDVGVVGFSGDCNPNPLKNFSGWESDLSKLESNINGLSAGGRTPLLKAITAAECKLVKRLQETGQSTGKLIILSDGDDTCDKIRPNGVYSNSSLSQQTNIVDLSSCGETIAAARNSTNIKYNTIGFNVKAGSAIERDLQFLSQISGGKYLNVQGQTQLERAFKKFNRIYVPKENPALNNLSPNSLNQFKKGVSEINSESFESALKVYEEFIKAHQDDCHGYYNLALMQEANDYYTEAIISYQQYLSICNNPSDKEFVEKQVRFLEKEFEEFKLFQKEVVMSDLAYLKLHFEKIQNGESVALAEEFKGFLKEKGDYYEKLSEKIGRTDRMFKKNCSEVANGLQNCAKTINRNPKAWDRDATPVISMTYLNLERLIESF